MSFYLPITSGVTRTETPLAAFDTVSAIGVKYRDTSGTGSSSSTITADSLKFDITQGFSEQIISGSVRFKIGNDTFIDRTGMLYRNVDPANNSGTASGTIQLGNGQLELTSWTPNVANSVTLQSLTTTTDLPPINHISFRTPVAPLRPASLTLVVASLDFGSLTITSDASGVINTSKAQGKVNHDTGFVDVYFYTKTKFTSLNRPDIEAQPWYDLALEYTETGDQYIDVPVWIAADSVRYSAIAYTYLPMDAELLGLSATRLPINGRVPVFRVGDIGIISASKSYTLPSAIAGTTYTLADARLSWVELEDSNGVKVPFDMYAVGYDYGTVTLGGDFSMGSLVAPLKARYRYQDMGVIKDVQINGQVTFTKPVTHNYDKDESIVGSAFVIGDMQARYTRKFVQSTWSNVWDDTAVGSLISANYNDALYPIAVTNNGNIQERWAIVFVDSANFRVIGENSGQIATGTISLDTAPINPVTNQPYFSIKKEGWGSGWASGNVLRFNTVAATYPVWVIRTVKQSEPTLISDDFQIMLRGDIDRIV